MDRNQKAKLEYQKMAEERDAVERARRYVDAIEKLSPFTSHGNERTSSGKCEACLNSQAFQTALSAHLIGLSCPNEEDEEYACMMRCVIRTLQQHAPNAHSSKEVAAETERREAPKVH